MFTITQEQQEKIAQFVNTHHLSKELGNEEEACSLAAINLALTGELKDEVPSCMSAVIGRWIIGAQDSMPDEMRNSAEWKSLLPLAAGTGRDKEAERLQIVLSWMWEQVLPLVQPIADGYGFGAEWKTMLQERTSAAAHAAAYAAARAAAYAAAHAAYAARAAARAAAYAAAHAAAYAAAHAAYAAAYAAYAATWKQLDPISLLRRLIEVE